MPGEQSQKVVKYECEGPCDFWQILHGNPGNVKYQEERYQEKLKNCQNCQRVQRIEAYKDFWKKRGD